MWAIEGQTGFITSVCKCLWWIIGQELTLQTWFLLGNSAQCSDWSSLLKAYVPPLVRPCSHFLNGSYPHWAFSLLLLPFILPPSLSYKVLILALSLPCFLFLFAFLGIFPFSNLFLLCPPAVRMGQKHHLAGVFFKAAVIGTCWDGYTDGACLFPSEPFHLCVSKSFEPPHSLHTCSHGKTLRHFLKIGLEMGSDLHPSNKYQQPQHF